MGLSWTMKHDVFIIIQKKILSLLSLYAAIVTIHAINAMRSMQITASSVGLMSILTNWLFFAAAVTRS
ncbi:hypothetical protein PBAT_24455 [Paenibacillus antarcticus]|uniref:Uncharacterized protein n=1 Tax=Paenibacillus antarcticus TaxID=253703 RepID=A0A162PYI3_9BACL|nr:hypothetical protein PBAT_24455 [Paenibacillus antarcticus]